MDTGCGPDCLLVCSENLLQVGTAGSSLADPDATSRASQVTGSSHDRTVRVAFAPDTVDRTGETEAEVSARLACPTVHFSELVLCALMCTSSRKTQ